MSYTICDNKLFKAGDIGSNAELVSGTEYNAYITVESRGEITFIFVDAQYPKRFVYDNVKSFYSEWEIIDGVNEENFTMQSDENFIMKPIDKLLIAVAIILFLIIPLASWFVW